MFKCDGRTDDDLDDDDDKKDVARDNLTLQLSVQQLD